MTTKPLQVFTALCGLLADACASPSESASLRYAVEFRMMNDDGQALGGVAIDTGKRHIGTTSDNGLLKAELSGDEGQRTPVTVSCPEGFTDPENMEPLRLTRTRRINRDGYQPLRIEAVCRRRLRDIVIAVRASEGVGLPLLVEGRPAGTTDGNGIVHVLVKADRTAPSISVTLDTRAHPELKPRNPSRTFDLAGSDALLVFNQTFVSTPKPALGVLRAKSKRHVPYRVE